MQKANEKIRVQFHGFVIAGFVEDIPWVTAITKGSSIICADRRSWSTLAKLEKKDTFQCAHIPWKENMEYGSAFIGSGAQYCLPFEQNIAIRRVRKAEHVAKKLFANKSDAHQAKLRASLMLRLNETNACCSWIARNVSARDRTVSPQAICVNLLSDGTGWFSGYDENGKNGHLEAIPSVSRGWPSDKIAEVGMAELSPFISEVFQAMDEGRPPPEFDFQSLSDAIRKISWEPKDSF